MINETSSSSTSSPTRAPMSRNVLFMVVGIVVLLTGFLAVAMLVNKNQDLRQQARVTELPLCSDNLQCVQGNLAGGTLCAQLNGTQTSCCPVGQTLNASKTACVDGRPAEPVCDNVTVNGTVVFNGKVSLTCKPVAGATRYEFRIKLPDGTIKTIAPLSAGSANSADFILNQSGGFKAQCRGCSGAGAETCAPYQAI